MSEKKCIFAALIQKPKVMKEVVFNEQDFTFYAWHEEECMYYEVDVLASVEFDESIMEITETKEEDDYKDWHESMLVGVADTEPACYEIDPELKDGEKLSVTLFKVKMPNDDVLELPVLTDERAVFISAKPSNGTEYWYYDEDTKREATDEEIDNIDE